VLLHKIDIPLRQGNPVYDAPVKRIPYASSRQKTLQSAALAADCERNDFVSREYLFSQVIFNGTDALDVYPDIEQRDGEGGDVPGMAQIERQRTGQCRLARTAVAEHKRFGRQGEICAEDAPKLRTTGNETVAMAFKDEPVGALEFARREQFAIVRAEAQVERPESTTSPVR
jgi:hypothetical protein